MEGKAEITDEFIQKAIASGRQYCLRLYKAGPNRDQPPEEADKNPNGASPLPISTAGRRKDYLINGPVIDDPELQRHSIFKTTDKEEVKRLADGDPAVKAGRLVYEIYHWYGLPGDCLPE